MSIWEPNTEELHTKPFQIFLEIGRAVYKAIYFGNKHLSSELAFSVS